jgi:hypothetical protein
MTCGHPPGKTEPINPNAAGTLKQADGSHVPVQPNSIKNLERSDRRELAP